MSLLKISVLAATLVVAATSAQATIVQTFDSRQAFVAAAPRAPVTTSFSLDGVAASLTVDSITFSALEFSLVGNGTILSTEADEDILVITFATPILGFGISGGVVGADFEPRAGGVSVSVGDLDGDGIADGAVFENQEGAFSFFGLVSHTPITQVTLAVDGFDRDALAAAFVGLEGRIDTVAVPEPATWAMMLLGFGLVAARLRQVPV